MIKFLSYVFFLFLFFYVIKQIGRIVLPFVLKRFFTKMNNSFSNQYSQKPQKREGEVTIDHAPKTKKMVNKDKGDYVDFEDIQE